MGSVARATLVVLFDSECTVCNRFVAFLAKRDKGGQAFRFEGLASEVGRKTLAATGLPADYSDSVVVVDEGKVLTRSAALIAIAGRMSLLWRVLGRAGSVVPSRVRDRWYGVVARHRRCSIWASGPNGGRFSGVR